MSETIETRCCVVGGGPAGMMAGFLLARMGVDVCVLEKHADFLRDFRGDTIHPSTLELMHELGLLEKFLARPHQVVTSLSAVVAGRSVSIADFTHLSTHCKFIALMPQWDFLDFLAAEARAYPGFHLRRQTEAAELIEENGAIVGVRAISPQGQLEIRAALTIGADGRRSTVRQKAGLKIEDLGAPMDVLWMRLRREAGDPPQSFGHAANGKVLVQINREEYWQCALVIPKGSAEAVRQRGLPAFRAEIAGLAPFLRDRVDELQDWKDVSVLTVIVDRLERWWRPGLLCIGDAAHAMSPIGGVGINLAIQDAVATANLLGAKLLRGGCTSADLHAVQHRRNFPTKATQWVQIAIQNRVIQPVLRGSQSTGLPLPLKLLRRWPGLRRIPGRLVGVGFRPEHIRTPGAR